MKKLLSFILISSIILNLVGCSSNVEVETNKEQEEKSITVVYFENWDYETEMDRIEARGMYDDYNLYYEYFTDITGIEVKRKFIKYKSEQDIMYQVNTKGRTGELGDLIFVKTDRLEEELDMTKWAQKIIKSGAAEDVRDQILSSENVKKNITKTAFIPVSMDFKMKIIHKEIVNEFDLNKREIITKSEELDMVKKIMKNKKIPICSEIINRELFYEDEDYYWFDNHEVKFDKSKLKENVKRVERRLKSGEYDLDKLYKLSFEEIENDYINYNRKKDIEFTEEFQVDNRVSYPFERIYILGRNQSKYEIRNHVKGYELGLYEKTIVPIEEMDLKLVMDDNTGKEGYLLMKSAKNKKEAIDFLKYITSEDGQAAIIAKQLRMPILKIDENLLDLALAEVKDPREETIYLENQREMIKRLDNFVAENLYKKYEELKEEEVTIKSLMRKDLYKIKIKMMFDKTYTEEKLDEDVDKMLNEVNLKLSEIL